MSGDLANSRPARGDYNRFVSFAFAATEMVAEIDSGGIITYAAGAFRSRLGRPAEHFVGQPVLDVVAPCDHDALHLALALLRERGRLLPCIVRLANPSRSHVVLAGLRAATGEADAPLCLTLGLPPMAVGAVPQATTAQRLIQTIQSRMAEGDPGTLALLQVDTEANVAECLAAALDEVSPSSLTSEVAPGRFGVLNDGAVDVAEILPILETALRRHGIAASVSSCEIPLRNAGLTESQATCALRQAFSVFAREGMSGIERCNFGEGLAQYVHLAVSQAKLLRQVISEKRFHALYQPIVSLETRQLHHYEALLRPAEGHFARSPQEFVTLVETAGLADELDLAMVHTVCEAADRSGARIAVNLSGHSVGDPAFRERLLTVFRASRAVQARRILVEMTETAQIDAVEEVARTAAELRRMGVRFCIDDFGAGSADIRLLRAIPTDVVKLDGSFVPGTVGGGRERAFVTGMVEIARAAGAEVVAEHIETEREAEALAEVGATFGQGWLFGRPAPLPEASRPPRATRRVGVKESWG